MPYIPSQKKLFDNISNIIRRFDLQPLASLVAALETTTKMPPIIDVAFLGEFKSGKTSLVNSLVGRDVFPVGVVPVTSVVCRLAFGEMERATVVFSDNGAKEIPFESISQFVDERLNPCNEKKVRYLDVMLSGLPMLKGLRFIDTPGLGSTHQHNTRATTEWVPNVGFALFAISVDRPLGESDIAFMRQALDHCPDLVVVLTKTDRCTAEQVLEIKDFLDSSLQREFMRTFRIYPYSVTTGVEMARQDLLNEVLLPLAKNHRIEHARIIFHKLRILSIRTLDYLRVALRATEQDQHRRDEVRKTVFDTRLSINRIRQEIDGIAAQYKAVSRERIWERLEKHEGEIIRDIRQNFKGDRDLFTENLSIVTEAFRQWLSKHLYSRLLDIAEQERLALSTIEGQAREHFSSYLSFFHQRLNDNLSKALDLSLTPVEITMDVEPWSSPDITVSRVFDIPLDILWFLFPMVVFQGLFLRYFASNIPWEVNKNLHRLTSDLTDSINVRIDRMAVQLKQTAALELDMIERLLADRPDTSYEITCVISDIESATQTVFNNRTNIVDSNTQNQIKEWL